MEINWIQVIVTILGSGMISVISALLTGFWLNVRTERIKSELQKFQTKFSVYHQKRAEAIAEIYSLFAELEYVLGQVTHWYQRIPEDEVLKKQLDERKIREVSRCSENFYVCFIKNRIFLDENTCKILDDLAQQVRASGNFYIESIQCKDSSMSNFSKSYFEKAKENLETIPEIKQLLEAQFREILSDENRNYQIEKKQ